VFLGSRATHLNRGVMDWNGYTVFSVISGITCILLGAFGKDVSHRNRVWCLLAGVFFLAYGIYVAAQESGTYYFPVFIFVLPFALVGKIIYDIIQKKKQPAVAQNRLVSDVDKKRFTGPNELNEIHDGAESSSPQDSEFALRSHARVSELDSAPPPASRGAQSPQGWYQDPLSARYRLRYWDGRAWTERVD
jgi:hypothetical protein